MVFASLVHVAHERDRHAALQQICGLRSTMRAAAAAAAARLCSVPRLHLCLGRHHLHQQQVKQSKDGRLADLMMSDEDERQLLAEKPALKAVYDAQVGGGRVCSGCRDVCGWPRLVVAVLCLVCVMGT